MPFTVGIDLASPACVSDSIRVHGGRYLRRVYTERELAACSVNQVPDASRLASCFAGKEAAIKALRVRDRAMPWRDVEVLVVEQEQPKLTLHGEVATVARDLGMRSMSLSVDRGHGLASAIVIAEFG